jgi:hypothetical protein
MANPSNSEQPSYSASHGHKNGHRRVWRDGVASRVATLDDLPTQCRHEARVLDQDWLDVKNHCGAGVFGERAGTRTRDLLIKSQLLYRLSYALVTVRKILPIDAVSIP